MEVLVIVIGVIAFIWLIARLNSGAKASHRTRSRPNIDEPLKPLNLPPRPTSATRVRAQQPPPFLAKQSAPSIGRNICGAGYVIDGDSLVIKKTQVRIFGVDAPEISHPYGKKAKWALVALCKGHEIRAEILAEDTHGRTVAKCYLPDGRDLSAEMVKQGLALDWPKYSGGVYRSMETADARRKLWLADARQNGRMHVWQQFEAKQNRS